MVCGLRYPSRSRCTLHACLAGCVFWASIQLYIDIEIKLTIHRWSIALKITQSEAVVEEPPTPPMEKIICSQCLSDLITDDFMYGLAALWCYISVTVAWLCLPWPCDWCQCLSKHVAHRRIDFWGLESRHIDVRSLWSSIFVLIEICGVVVCDGCLTLQWQGKETSKELLVTSSRSKMLARRLLSHRLGAVRHPEHKI